jgi:predicted phosphohydrolase
MNLWALGDLHLSFGLPNKSMDIFGPAWQGHAKQIETAWLSTVQPEDLVLIPGDISWAMKIEDAVIDLKWIDRLPGTKVMIKGNHDYWWGSLGKIAKVLPPSIHLIQNNSFRWKNVAIGGSRLWDTSEYGFSSYIEWQENPTKSHKDKEITLQKEMDEKIFERELQRLELSLSTLPKDAKLRIAMTHYPPIGADLLPSRASQILERHNISICVFGHLHNVRSGLALFGEKNGVRYVLASGDYVRFQPIALGSL